MQLLRLTDVPPINQSDRVFLYSRLRAVLGAALLAAPAIGAFLLAWFSGAWLGYYIGAVLLTLLLIFQNLVTARFRPSNWLLRATDHGLFIKFRSYLNHHFDERDLTVVFLPYSEIRSARSFKEAQNLPDRDDRHHPGATTRTRRAIELELAGDCTALSRLLANERERVFAKSVVGAGRISTRYQHLPVRMAGPKLLRIDWGVVPTVQILLESLTRHVAVQDRTAVSKDFTALETLSKEQQEARLLELMECGETMAAVALARRLYSYDLTTAKQFVEALASGKPHGRKSPVTADEILTFWFGSHPDDTMVINEKTALWWSKNPDADREISQRFRDIVDRAAAGELSAWEATPRGRLALILLTDQFPRNIYRNSPQAFAYDAKALAWCLDGLQQGLERNLRLIERVFFYLPLEHAESLGCQDKSVEKFRELLEVADAGARQTFMEYVDFAVRHRNIIRRFGRFPHRNKILGRASTEEEAAFLDEPGSSF